MKSKARLFGSAPAALLAANPPAQAQVVYGFKCITWNVAAQCATAPQYTVEVEDLGSGLVGFKFRNTAAVASSITDVYFSRRRVVWHLLDPTKQRRKLQYSGNACESTGRRELGTAIPDHE